ncbi:hypothetical protein [Shimia sediminis]|uniref:hypothetical protein n=1 Tax=Shimia sediminis TaxID=2497945 RepID=UPI000F8E5322|nr:hypothetical protein [Shimia sediminis]
MSINSEKALWQEVLLLQVDDALLGATGANTRKHRIVLIDKARAYLTTPSSDLETVCTLAGIDMAALIEAMRAKIANAPSPTELASRRKANAATLRKRPKQPQPKRVKIADRPITFNGTTLTIQQWADRTGLTAMQIYSRLRQGFTVERALTQPMNKRNRGWGATGAANVTHAPGVGSNFGRLEGTGGGRSAQDRPKISFSSNEKVEA